MQTVFHLITGDAEEQETALTIAENLTEDESVDVTDVAVVAQSEGTEPLRAERDGSDTVREFIDQGIEFRACGTRSTYSISPRRTWSTAWRPSRRAWAN
jgi:intracellular sulfur oxidation DsrE/DsrF family protein